MSTKAKKKKDCKDFPSFSCEGKGLHDFIVNGQFSAENIFTTLFIYLYCSLMQTGPANQSAHNNYVVLSDGTYTLI